MTSLDFLLILFLGGYVLAGWGAGLIHGVGSLVGIFLGVLAASRWFAWLAPKLKGAMGETAATIIAFALIFLVVTRLVGLAFAVLNRVFNLVAIVPGMKMTNRFLGAVLGFLEGVFAVGITLHFVSRLPFGETVTNALEASALAPLFAAPTAWLVGLMPEVIRTAESVFR